MIRIGVIGAGPNGKGHVEYFARSSRAKVVAIADPVTESAARLAGPCGAKVVSDYRQLLDLVDAVVIASPNFLHREQAIAVAEAGKHVYCEKPMGLCLAEARDIASAVDSARVASAVGFSSRFDGILHTMAEMAGAGELGRVLSVCSRRLGYHDLQNVAAWRKDHRQSGGLLLEINVHELDWMMAVGGEVESVYARTWAANPDSPRSNDQIFVMLGFDSGATGMHEGSWLSPIGCYYRSIQGTEAGVNTDEWGSKLYHARVGQGRTEMAPGTKYDLRGNFLDSIEQGVPGVADVHWGLKVMTVAEAIFDSARTGLPVRLASEAVGASM